MNATVKPPHSAILPVEADLAALTPSPTLLPGESMDRYRLMRGAILSDLSPTSAIEWLIAVDVVELSWEIERYRFLRHKVLDRHREQAIEQCLRRIDLVEISPENEGEATRQIRTNAFDWRTDPEANAEIEARLAAYGFDNEAINAESILQAREAFLLFQALIDAALGRRASLLREIRIQRMNCRSCKSRRRS
jgi:hypothetical protein